MTTKMDRLFRKRTTSTANESERPATLKKQPSGSALNESFLKRRVDVSDALTGRGRHTETKEKGKERDMEQRGLPDEPPSINVDIRNSLILPGLSQRFSVLLPSLSCAPEDTLRSLLASQRHGQGPSLTVEEEEMLFAEMRLNSPRIQQDVESWQSHDIIDRNWSSTSLSSTEEKSLNRLSTSVSSPSFSSDKDHSSPITDSKTNWPISPPATSNSFSSFKTFGQDDNHGVKTKSYGFSGSSALRDADYIRRVKKNAQKGDGERKSVESEIPDREYTATDFGPDSFTTSDDATGHDNVGRLSPSTNTWSTVPPPLSPPPSGPLPTPPVYSPGKSASGRARMRQSLLAGLTPAQVKRISMALGEIDARLYRSPVKSDQLEEEEETLQPAPSPTGQYEHAHRRHHSDALSDISSSTISSAFPYKTSPIGSTPQTKVEGPSPSRLPPSPRSMNLHAQIAPRSEHPPLPQPIFRPTETSSSLPRPIMTPSRTQPIRHNPSSSISGTFGENTPSPGYVPGQPRPVRMTHHSQSSMSSRADTPTQFSPVTHEPPALLAASASSQPQSDRSSSPLSTKISSLARSLSANQGDRSRSPATDRGNMHFRAQSLDTNLPMRRGSSSLGHAGPSETIEEEGDVEGSPIDEDVPQIRAVPARHNVADLKRQYSHSKRRSVGVKQGLQVDGRAVDTRRESQQDTIDESLIDTGFSDLLPSSPTSLRRQISSGSIGSDYAGASPEIHWDGIFQRQTASFPSPPAPDDTESAVDMLRKLSGVGSDELSTLQARLIEKAKAERMVLRGSMEDSPDMPISPAFAAALQPPIPALGPIISAASQRSANSPLPSDTTSPDMPSETFSPISTDRRAVSPSERATIHTASRRAAPPPPDTVSLETPLDEVVSTPPTDLSRKPSRMVAPEDDPDVRRDFEARIAAATAALNRTPSVNVPLQRKNTRKGGVMKISSPTLVSSSAKLGGHALTPTESPVDTGIAKALKNASGSGSKMSMRWRKLGFKRGTSISNNPDIYTPPSSAPSTQSTRLEDPIALRSTSPPPMPQSAPLVPPSAYKAAGTNVTSPDLNAFRFPMQEGAPSVVVRSHSTKAEPQSGIRQVMGKMRRGKSDDKAQEPVPETRVAQVSAPVQVPRQTHSASNSNDSAVAKFIEAGRAVGLNDEQLQDMLVARGMLSKSQMSASTESGREMSSTPTPVDLPHSSPAATHMSSAPSTAPPTTERKVSGPKSLLRSLSRNKRSKADLKESTPPPETLPEPMPRSAIVRRTILVPQEAAGFNSLARQDVHGSPTQYAPSSVGQRKPSIKRKPVNLTREDHDLVQNSPPAHPRKVSAATTSSAMSEGDNPGLGFLQPVSGPAQSSSSIVGVSESDSHSMARSSGDGSLYDLYRSDDPLETLQSPTNQATPNKRSTQAVEITEYADGKVVWSLVDALRDEDEDEEIQFGTPADLQYRGHSITESLDSRRDSVGGSGGDIFTGPTNLSAKTAGLTFRHRDRGPSAPRPPTDVYFTSSADVADLMDHLRSNLDASRGRIDILPPSEKQHIDGSPRLYRAESTSRSPHLASTESGQFEDAPSPQRHIPHPIILPRPYANGSLPQRQLFGGAKGVNNMGNAGNDASPSAASFAASFASSTSGLPVEDRLQALLDRLKDSGTKANR